VVGVSVSVSVGVGVAGVTGVSGVGLAGTSATSDGSSKGSGVSFSEANSLSSFASSELVVFRAFLLDELIANQVIPEITPERKIPRKAITKTPRQFTPLELDLA
jgi:hypothetical protein